MKIVKEDKYIIDKKQLKKIMKLVREDLNFRMGKHYAKYATMEIRKIIINNSEVIKSMFLYLDNLKGSHENKKNKR